MSDLLSFLNLARTTVLRSRTSNYRLNFNNQYKPRLLFRRRERVQVSARPRGQLQKLVCSCAIFLTLSCFLNAPTVSR